MQQQLKLTETIPWPLSNIDNIILQMCPYYKKYAQVMANCTTAIIMSTHLSL